jgi:hypothetical protein
MAMLLSSGFPTQKSARTPVGVLPAPTAPVLKQGPRSGELTVTTKAMSHAASYMWQLALASAPATILRTLPTTAARTVFPGLTLAQTYVVTVAAVGSAGQGAWSEATQAIAT